MSRSELKIFIDTFILGHTVDAFIWLQNCLQQSQLQFPYC